MEQTDIIEESLERLRRIETRITKLCQFLGLDTNTKKPTWSVDQGTVIVPTDACSLRDILAAIPSGRGDENSDVEIWHKGRYVATIYVVAE